MYFHGKLNFIFIDFSCGSFNQLLKLHITVNNLIFWWFFFLVAVLYSKSAWKRISNIQCVQRCKVVNNWEIFLTLFRLVSFEGIRLNDSLMSEGIIENISNELDAQASLLIYILWWLLLLSRSSYVTVLVD